MIQRSGRDEFHTSSNLALNMMCEPAMVVAADLSRSLVMFSFGTSGRSSCRDVLVEGSQCPRVPISIVMSFVE